MMNPTWMPDAIAICSLALTGILLGAVTLLAGGRRASARRALLLAGGLALVGASAWFAGVPAFGWLPFAGLVPVWLLFALCRTPLPEKLSRGVVIAVSHPRIQAVVLLTGSATLLCWQIYRLDQTLAGDMDNADLALELACGVPDLVPMGRPALTDAGHPVTLSQPRSSEDEATAHDTSVYLRRRQLEWKLIETGTVDASYNCHGWIFAAGQGWVRGGQVDRILKDNGYVEVASPVPGDIAIYRNEQGEVMHTALVRGVGDTILLESKWGRLGRYIHTNTQHAYTSCRCVWYRTARSTHALRNLNYDQATARTGNGT